jgi:CheY-like chemotaxis protein
MLGVIIGSAELALEMIAPAGPVRKKIDQILYAAEKSAKLTQQLLAFARKQAIAPKVLDLNETMESMLKMLRRLIGEDIELTWHPGSSLSPIKMDPTQVDQILANLCVNARDAIAGTGKLTIETGNVTIDESYCADHAEGIPGDYVLLAVSDNGIGIDKETMEHIFEPFFTTKVMGLGTGLGLATVYGIVKQNNGFINVYSEPGLGTTFKIHLPRHEGKPAGNETEFAVEIPRSHGETVLLVEDEPMLLNLSKNMLARQGYTVLAANSPDEAILLSKEYAGDINLLMTDVVMPGMNGQVLAERIRLDRPEMKCLFMSGYTSDVIVHHGVLDEGVQFIPKPFSIKVLAVKVREVLDQK